MRCCPWALGLALVLGGCTSRVVPRVPDGGATDDMGRGDWAEPPDLGPRTPWRTLSPTPEDSDLQAVFGVAETNYYLITAGALLRRTGEESTTLWRGAQPACLRGLTAVGDDVIVSGGCNGVGLLLRSQKGQAPTTRELPNLVLAGLWARSAQEVYVASPSAGVLRVAGDSVALERTVAQGELGTGPVALWGQGADVYAVGNGRVLHRRSEGQWEVERSAPDERQLAIWGSGTDDIYVVGATDRGGALWHRNAVGVPFKAEAIVGATPAAVVAVWGNGKDEVYAAADGGLILRREPLSSTWLVDRPGSPDQSIVRSLWGAAPGHLLAAGPGGLSRRRSGGAWDVVLGQALTGATLRGLALTAPDAGLAVGDAGVVLRQQGGRWSREAQGLTSADLYAVAVAADGGAYAVGEGGVVLRRDRGGAWALERPFGDGGAGAPDLRAVAMGAGGQVFVVGDKARIAVRDGGVWQPEPELTSPEGTLRATLRAVAAMADGTVVAAGDEGTVLWRPRATLRFSVVRREPSAGLSYSGLALIGGELWASASGGAVVLRLAAGQLHQEPAPIAQASAIYGTGPDDVYLAGRDGSVWHSAGWGWQREPAPAAEALLGLAGSGDTVIAAGEHGFLMQRP